MLLPSTPSSQTLFLPPRNCPLEPSLGQQCVPSSPALPHTGQRAGETRSTGRWCWWQQPINPAQPPSLLWTRDMSQRAELAYLLMFAERVEAAGGKGVVSQAPCLGSAQSPTDVLI